MRAAVVGAGVAGLATAAALTRSGHTVTVYEQATSLRASGLAFHLWSNSTSLLPELGVPADRIPGEPVNRMLLRAAGHPMGSMDLTPAGLPHVTVERADVLGALAAGLPEGTITYGTRCTDVAELAGDHELVVVADGAHSALRRAIAGTPRRRWRWTVWQACLAVELPEMSEGCGVSVIRPGMSVGVFALGGGRFTWFVELPGRTDLDGARLLHALGHDEDPLLRTLAAATAPEAWIRWRAEDLWPRRPLYRGNVVLVGDAAHAMLPPATQGACQAVEDAVVLADALAEESGLDEALRRYEMLRLPRVRRAVAMGRVGALARPSNPVIRAIPRRATRGSWPCPGRRRCGG